MKIHLMKRRNTTVRKEVAAGGGERETSPTEIKPERDSTIISSSASDLIARKPNK